MKKLCLISILLLSSLVFSKDPPIYQAKAFWQELGANLPEGIDRINIVVIDQGRPSEKGALASELDLYMALRDRLRESQVYQERENPHLIVLVLEDRDARSAAQEKGHLLIQDFFHEKGATHQTVFRVGRDLATHSNGFYLRKMILMINDIYRKAHFHFQFQEATAFHLGLLRNLSRAAHDFKAGERISFSLRSSALSAGWNAGISAVKQMMLETPVEVRLTVPARAELKGENLLYLRGAEFRLKVEASKANVKNIEQVKAELIRPKMKRR